MKKISIYLLVLIALASCSKPNSDGGNMPQGGVAITLSSGVSTKAPIVNGTNFTGTVAGWESSAAVDYTTTAAWSTTATVTAQESAQAVAFGTQPYYNPLTATKTYIKAWYPQGTPAGGVVSFPTPDGVTDVLFADQIVGDKENTTGKVLSFNHKLTQLIFKVVADVSMATIPTLNSITIRDAELPTSLNLATNALGYAAAADLSVPSIVANQTITTTSTVAGLPVMVKPKLGNSFNVSVVTSETTYADATVTIDNDENFVEGKSYTITLTFKSKNEIILSATVTPWKAGSGSATVE